MNPKNWNETTRAIVASGVIALVLSGVLLGSPFRAFANAFSNFYEAQ